MATDSHQAHARRDGEFIDLLLAPRSATTWLYRRDERVTLPLPRAILTARLPSGRTVPYLAPEAVLLFKSRSSRGGEGGEGQGEGGGDDGAEAGPRGKDADDFARVAPTLDAEARAWLAEALRTVHGEHAWLAEL